MPKFWYTQLLDKAHILTRDSHWLQPFFVFVSWHKKYIYTRTRGHSEKTWNTIIAKQVCWVHKDMHHITIYCILGWTYRNISMTSIAQEWMKNSGNSDPWRCKFCLISKSQPGIMN